MLSKRQLNVYIQTSSVTCMSHGTIIHDSRVSTDGVFSLVTSWIYKPKESSRPFMNCTTCSTINMKFINPKVKDEERSEWKEDLATREEDKTIDGCRTTSTGSIQLSGESCMSSTFVRDGDSEACTRIEQLNCFPTEIGIGVTADHQSINDQPNGIPLLPVVERKSPFQHTCTGIDIDSTAIPPIVDPVVQTDDIHRYVRHTELNLQQQRQRLDELHCQIQHDEAMLEALQHQSDVSFVSFMTNNPENQRLYGEWRTKHELPSI